MNSIGSSTNSNISTGPSVNTTGRLDINTSSTLTKSDNDLYDVVHNAKRGDIMVSASMPGMKRRSAYQLCMPNSYQLPNDTVVGKREADTSMAQYFTRLNDARTDFEYYCAKHMLGFKSEDRIMNQKLLVFQAHMQDYDDIVTFEDDEQHRTCAKMINIDVQADGLFSIEFRVVDNVITCSIRGVEGVSETLFTHVFTDKLKEHLANNNPMIIPNKTSSPIKPPEFIYAGVALTDACMHPRNGDTAVTLNHYGAMTSDNGPADVCAGDVLKIIPYASLKKFDVQGNRFSRNILSVSFIYAIVTGIDFDFDHYRNNRSTTLQKMKSSRKARISDPRQNRPGSDDRKLNLIYSPWVLMPSRSGFGIHYGESIEDKKNRVGKAVSSCTPYGRLDWINGHSSEM